MSERETTPDSQPALSRREILGYGTATLGLAAAAIYTRLNGREQQAEESHYVLHKITADDVEQGPEALVKSFFPNLNEEEIEQYIKSGLFVNITAEADKREPTDLKENDTIEL